MTYDSRPATYEHIAEVRGLLLTVAAQLIDRAHEHDESKLADPELATFNEYTPKLREAEYGSDEYKGYLAGMGEGLAHHYAANRHHPEHFADGVRGMNALDLIEMLCDWLAATRRVANGDIDRSITQNRDRFGYGDEIETLLRNTLDAILEDRA